MYHLKTFLVSRTRLKISFLKSYNTYGQIVNEFIYIAANLMLAKVLGLINLIKYIKFYVKNIVFCIIIL
jgi:hypothetical protein